MVAVALVCLKCACYSQLEILQKIEKFGGSSACDLNPDAFTDLVPVSQRRFIVIDTPADRLGV